MTPRFSLLVPTRERPTLAKRFLASVVHTAFDPSAVEAVLYIDDDDEASATIDYPGLSVKKVVGPRRSMAEMTQACLANSAGRYIVLLNDDAVIRTRYWDVAVAEAFSSFPDQLALVYPDDGYYGERLSTFPIVSRAVCDVAGPQLFSRYQRHCIDSHIFDVFRRLSELGAMRSVFLPDVVFEHMNYGAATTPWTSLAGDYALYSVLAADRQRTAERLATAAKPWFPATTSPVDAACIVSARGIDIDGITATLNAVVALEPRLSEIVLVSDAHESHFPLYIRRRVRFAETDAERPLPQGIAQAAHDTTASWLCFLDAPSVPRRDWLARLLAKASGGAGVVGSKWLNPRTGRTEHAGLAFLRRGLTTSAVSLYQGCPAEDPLTDKPRALQAVGRSGMLVSRSLFARVGGFSAILPGLEHVDLCLKARRLGFSVELSADAVICFSSDDPQPAAEAWDALIKEHDGRFNHDAERLLADDGVRIEREAYRTTA